MTELADETILALGISAHYMNNTVSSFNRRALIAQAISLARVRDPTVPLRGDALAGFRSPALALETWRAEKLSVLATDRLSEDDRRDLDIAVHCAVAAGLASQRPELLPIMRGVIEVLTSARVTQELRTMGLGSAGLEQRDARALAARLVELENEIARLKTAVARKERSLAVRVQEFDRLTGDLIGRRSHLDNLKLLMFGPE